MPPTDRETELKFHVGYLPDLESFTASLATLGWNIAASHTHTQHDTYVNDDGGALAHLQAALRWREVNGAYIVAIKQEQATTGAHFTRFEIEIPSPAPTHVDGPFIQAIERTEIPEPIAQWLHEHAVTAALTPLLWITTKRTAITAAHGGFDAEFALDTVTAQRPGSRHAFTFHEIECEYRGAANTPLLQHTERLLANLPGARPSPASKLDFSLHLL